MDIISQIITEQKTWFQIFDIIRIIEPGGTHRMVSYKGKETMDMQLPCYSFWKRGDHCANCVSKRSDKKQAPIMKLEYRENQPYIVIAKPIQAEGKRYILELIMNISNQIQSEEEDGDMKTYVLDLLERLEYASSKDSFTKLYNKLYMKEIYEKLRQEPERKNLYLALFDIDQFKQINDSYGHALGDEVILNVSECIQEELSDKDGIAARFGGDEFGIIFYCEDQKVCEKKLLELNRKLDTEVYQGKDRSFFATLSYGMAEVKNTADFADAIQLADNELYFVKHKKKQNGC